MALRSFLVLLLFASPAYAQSLITGTVTDPQSAVIPDARVALLSGQAELRSTRSDAQGRYRFDAVQPGTYVVSVNSPGFQQATSPDIVVTAGLEGGEVVVTAGVHALRSGQKVRFLEGSQ